MSGCQARNQELRRKEAMYEKEISDLQKNSVEFIKKRISEVRQIS